MTIDYSMPYLRLTTHYSLLPTHYIRLTTYYLGWANDC
jgi:hypothetical protein